MNGPPVATVLRDAIRQVDGGGKIVATISREDARKAGARSKSGPLAGASDYSRWPFDDP
ncbi:MAG TPA: hypothetical protein VFQ44_17965 [Streptosporangiaceae bacterium]|nr:hypothetical protein [Streptosporangiaceae bacterium]